MVTFSLASLYDSLHALERIVGPFPVLCLALDRSGRILMSSARARDAFGLSEVAMLERRAADLIPDLDIHLEKDRDGQPLARLAPGPRVRRARVFGPGGSEVGGFPAEVHVSAARFGDTDVVFLALHDLSDRLKAERALRQSEDLLRAVLSGVPAQITAKAADGRYTLMNAYAAEVFGVQPESAVGKTSAQILGAAMGRPIDRLDREFLAGRAVSRTFEETVVDAEGRKRRFLTTKGALRDQDGRLRDLLSVSIDVTHRDAAEQRLERLSQHDDLTGLPRRPALLRALTRQIESARTEKGHAALLLIGVDSLSEIGAEHGQLARDSALRRLAIRLGGLVDEEAVVGRVETELFAIALPACADPRAFRRRAVAIADQMATPVPVGAEAVVPKVSHGVAVWPEDGLDADDLIRVAEEGRRGHRSHPPRAAVRPEVTGFADRVRARRALETALRRDLEHDRLTLGFIPIRTLPDAGLAGFRAMVCGSDGAPLDATALDLVDREGLSGPIGDWLLRRSCLARRAWDAATGGRARIGLEITLTAQQLLQPDFPSVVADILAETDTAPEALRLGVTEALAMQDAALVGALLDDLADVGVSLGLDGFGDGPASLMHLRRFPIRRVGLAPALLDPFPLEPDRATLLSSTVKLLRDLGKTVVVEEVRSDAQLAFLADLGCDEGSGPRLGDRLDAEGAGRLVAKGLPLAV